MATLTVSVALLAIVVFVLSGSCLELLKDIRQLREVNGILDRPLNLDIGRVENSRPSEHGLPATLDSAAGAVVLFLSEKCGTCRTIIASFDKSMRALPNGLWVVMEGRTQKSLTDFVNVTPLRRMMSDGRVVIDTKGEIAAHIGLDLTPVGFRVENGRLTSATTVPSSRYLLSILPKPVSLKQNLKQPPELKEAEA